VRRSVESVKAAVTANDAEQENLTDDPLAASPEQELDRELQEMGVGDFASVSWAFDRHLTVEIVNDLNTITGAAIDVESDALDLNLSTQPYLEAVRIELLRDKGECNRARIEIPELVLGDLYDLLSEEATRGEIGVLESDARAGLADGLLVRACICEHLGELRLEVELPETPVLIFTVRGDSRKALSLRIAQDGRHPTESKGQAIHVEVPNGIFGDIREKDRLKRRRELIASTKQLQQ
jgi:hypothetical protein